MKASLIMVKADGDQREFPLKKPVTVIGRMHTCDLRIPLSSISREHCQIELRDDGLYLRDLGSSNGTYHNDRRIMETKLDAGDTINTGPCNFTVIIDGVPSDFSGEPTEMPGGEEVTTREETEEQRREMAAEPTRLEPEVPVDSDEVDIEEPAPSLTESADQTPVDLDVAVDDEPVSGMDVLAELEDEDQPGFTRANPKDMTVTDEVFDEEFKQEVADGKRPDPEESHTLEPILEPGDNGDDEEDEEDDAMLDKLSAMDSAEITDPQSLRELREEEPEPIAEDLSGDDDYEDDAPIGDDPISALDALSALDGGGGGGGSAPRHDDPEDALSWLDEDDD